MRLGWSSSGGGARRQPARYAFGERERWSEDGGNVDCPFCSAVGGAALSGSEGSSMHAAVLAGCAQTCARAFCC
jgi:hypothetical protein